MSRDRRKRSRSSIAAVKASAVELADTGNAHQPTASLGCSDHPSYVCIDRHDLNEVQIEIVTADLVGAAEVCWDVVTAGDVCYEREMAERVVPWLRALAARGALVLLGDPGRPYLPGGGLVECRRYVVPTSRELEDRDTRDTIVWRVLPG
jgi:predicted nicotinamide N-methyase